MPDVVLLDLMLPDINGFDVCRRLRTDRATMLIPVVMLTALDDASTACTGSGSAPTPTSPSPTASRSCSTRSPPPAPGGTSMDQRSLQGEIHVELNSEITLLKDLNDFLMHVCQATPLTDEQVMQLRQAVMEMAQNAIEWGNQHQSDRLVKITYRVYEDRLEIVDPRPGARVRPRRTCPTPRCPTTRSRTWTSATSSASAPAASA